MSAPQMKERPASMLRSMFAGLGSLLNVMDKVRSKPAKQQTPARPETTAEPAAAPPAAPEPQATTVAEPEATTVPGSEATTVPEPEAAAVAEPEVTPETLAEAEDALADVEDTDDLDVVTVDTATEDTAAEDTAAEDTAEPEIVLVETDVVMVETDPVTGEPEAAVVETEIVALPLVNYDELSVASLRARLRNLSVGQLNDLLDYEKTHAARPDVITMFERRIAKVQAESQ